jgi:hypothetical protein
MVGWATGGMARVGAEVGRGGGRRSLLPDSGNEDDAAAGVSDTRATGVEGRTCSAIAAVDEELATGLLAGEGAMTGSAGVSSEGVPGSECRPTGLRGRRRVPLLGFGLMPMESQTML